MSLTLTRHFVIPWIHRLGTARFRYFLVKYGSSLKTIISSIYVMSDTAKDIYRSKEKVLHDGDGFIQGRVGVGKDIVSITRT